MFRLGGQVIDAVTIVVQRIDQMLLFLILDTH